MRTASWIQLIAAIALLSSAGSGLAADAPSPEMRAAIVRVISSDICRVQALHCQDFEIKEFKRHPPSRADSLNGTVAEWRIFVKYIFQQSRGVDKKFYDASDCVGVTERANGGSARVLDRIMRGFPEDQMIDRCLRK